MYNDAIADCMSSLKVPHLAVLAENPSPLLTGCPDSCSDEPFGVQEISTMLFRWIRMMDVSFRCCQFPFPFRFHSGFCFSSNFSFTFSASASVWLRFSSSSSSTLSV